MVYSQMIETIEGGVYTVIFIRGGRGVLTEICLINSSVKSKGYGMMHNMLVLRSLKFWTILLYQGKI